jgi:DNA-binding NarL/FixJ family response regulator
MLTAVRTRGPLEPAAIVVADARARVRQNLERTLSDQSDMRVVESCETSRETWRCLRLSAPEVLLLDWRLPDTGGLALLRRLDPGPDLKVILLTDEQSPEILAEAMVLGARGVVSGSAGPSTLVRCARGVLAGELWFPRRVTRALRDRINLRSPRLHLPDLEDLLTPREAGVARAAAEGRTNRAIALQLGISHQTVRHHLKSVFAKLHVSSRLELALLVTQNRL